MAKKIVNVYAPVSIRTVTPPIYGTCKNISMSTGDILTCLCRRAKVEEVLPDGSTIKLDMTNYYLDNAKNIKPVKTEEKPSQAPVAGAVAPTEEAIMADDDLTVLDLDSTDEEESTIEEQTEDANEENTEADDTAEVDSVEEADADVDTSDEEVTDVEITEADAAPKQQNNNHNNHNNKKHKHH